MKPVVPGDTIAFVGLGNMGQPMTGHLLAAGFDVRGYDVSDAARDAFAQQGGQVADSLVEAVPGARVLILMLPNSTIVESVTHEIVAAGALDADCVVMDMSSSEPLRTRSLAAELGQRGTVLVDAPVSGGVVRARTGTLTIMTGGPEDVLEQLSQVLAAMGTPVRAGTVGAGHAAKALNNLLSASHLLATAEAMTIGESFGLDPEVLLSIINTSTGRSASTEYKWPTFVFPETFNSGFAMNLMVKDVGIAVGLAEQVHSPHGLASETLALWAEAARTLPATADHTEVARWVGQLAGEQKSPIAEGAGNG